MTQNINGLGQFAENTKDLRQKEMMLENRVDVMECRKLMYIDTGGVIKI